MRWLICLISLLMTGFAIADPVKFQSGFNVTNVLDNGNSSWCVRGDVVDNAISGFNGYDVTTNHLFICESPYGDIDFYSITNITYTSGVAIAANVIYNGTATVARIGQPVLGQGALCSRSELEDDIPIFPGTGSSAISEYLYQGINNEAMRRIMRRLITYTNDVGTLPTNNWNTAYLTANWSSNSVVATSNQLSNLPTSTWNTVVIVSNETAWASNAIVATSNQLSSLPTSTWNTVVIASNIAYWASNSVVLSTNWITVVSNDMVQSTNNLQSQINGMGGSVNTETLTNWVQNASNTASLGTNWITAVSNDMVQSTNNLQNQIDNFSGSTDTSTLTNWVVATSNQLSNLPTNGWSAGTNIAVGVSNTLYNLPTSTWNTVVLVSNETAWASNALIAASNW